MHAKALLSAALLVVGAASNPVPQLAAAATNPTGALPTAAASDPSDAAGQLQQLSQNAVNTALTALTGPLSKRGTCSLGTLTVRKEWGSLKSSEKKAYIAAVQCLQGLPAKTPSSLVPGAKSRYDDFVATHINQTMAIHYTGTFLSWHRWFVWEYEQALRNECGYTGAQPYWDWAKTAVTGLAASPIFDGSDTSLSGNGAPVANEGNIVLGANSGLPPVYLPPGTGGGCVTSGPFASMTVNLGPVALDTTNGTEIANPGGLFAWNPRCLKRDLTDAINKRYANATGIVNLVLNAPDVATFQMRMQGVPGSGDIGVHGGAHYSIGGDPGRDVFTSPGDPVFFLHHANIDRVWSMWQLLDLQARVTELAQTGTFLNMPASANTTVDTLINLGYAAGSPTRVGDLLSTWGGPFCYIYL